jgi:signal transduction histidine kinase
MTKQVVGFIPRWPCRLPRRQGRGLSRHFIFVRQPEKCAGELVSDELDQLRAAHPQHRLDLEVAGDTRGVWDGQRLQQLLTNLVMNAIKYGAPDAPVRVVVTGDTAEVRLEVKNSGAAIDTLTLERIFDPLQRGPHHEPRHDADGSLGLGLYIVREIAKAHRGEINARSDKTETVFTVRLPRRGLHS